MKDDVIEMFHSDGTRSELLSQNGATRSMTGINAKRAVERYEKLAALGPAPPQSRPWKLRQWLRAYRAIMALDISEMAEMLRGVYTDEKLRALADAPNPFIAVITKAIGPLP